MHHPADIAGGFARIPMCVTDAKHKKRRGYEPRRVYKLAF